MLIGGNSPLQLTCSCQSATSADPAVAAAQQPATQGDLQSVLSTIGSMLGLSGLGDDPPAAAPFDWSFAGGSALTALLCGVGLIVAAKTVFEPKKRTRKKWANGAWRNDDYEERSSDYGVRPARRRKKAA